MNDTAQTAPPATSSSSAKPRVIKNPRRILLEVDKSTRRPAFIHEGRPGKPGEIIHFLMENGNTYAGEVKETTEVDGEVLVEFKDDLTLVEE